ncbi:MAG: secondary thiamine-phosphate synthase enzyme YjbQ [Bacillota bacterium]
MHAHPMMTEKIATRQRSEMIDITRLVGRVVRQAGVQSGIAVVHVPHTTAGVTINENADPDVQHDLLRKLETMVPQREAFYRHGEGNSDSHVKTSLIGNSVTVLVENGELVLGTWQAVYLCEFDGPRERSVVVKVMGE